jgi:AraC-like DNA-binding protein
VERRDPPRQTATVPRVAEMGFSDPSAFQRAFKRWKGMSPGQFKATKE